ncbi:hypothetical protein BH11BAC2_BH11BAC2_13550 [soil metagenome]
MQHYYEILGVPEGSDEITIKKAFRKKAMLLHPDRNSAADAEDQFIELNTAYDYLINAKHGIFSSPFVHEELIDPAREKAKAYARMRYEEFIQRNKAFDRLSIHRLFWGRKTTCLLILISCFLLYDNFSKSIYRQISISKPVYIPRAKVDQNSVVLDQKDLDFYQRDLQQNPEDYERIVILKTTPLLKFIKEYRMGNEGFRNSYTPAQSMIDYIPLAAVVLLLSILSLIYRFRDFEKKLAVKMISLIAIVSYLLAFLATT